MLVCKGPSNGTSIKNPMEGHLCSSLISIIIFVFLNNRLEHEKLHAKHKGHEAMHMEMLLILLATLIVAQLILFRWKSYHPRSYHVCHLFNSFSPEYPVADTVIADANNFLIFQTILSGFKSSCLPAEKPCEYLRGREKLTFLIFSYYATCLEKHNSMRIYR